MPSRSRTVRLDPALDRFVADHAAAVAAAGGGRPNYTRSMHALLRLAQGDAPGLRRDLYRPLAEIAREAERVRAASRHPDAVAAAERIGRAVAEVERRLAGPTGG